MDHPRSRGVYPCEPPRWATTKGSSPLARGLPRQRAHHSETGRIIPARAGFTGKASRRASRAMDHPRSRGVYPPARLRITDIEGSSPLARGLRGNRPLPLHGDRIIPARAGFTRRRRRPSSASADHPRSRGVYFSWINDTLIPGRIIPARAGFTTGAHGVGGTFKDHPRSRGVYEYPPPPHARQLGSSPLARGLLRR